VISKTLKVWPSAGFAITSGAALLVVACSARAGGITPDGGTATSIATGTNGRQTASIAPAIGGVSNNTYSSFNVSKAGADLNNNLVNANTIINQVTGTSPSLIQGDITVLGLRANVILANPNGVTIDGGSFVTNGHVVISTGQVSFNDLTTAPGVTQRNVVLTTNGGTITIGQGGLRGTLVNLDLIAKQLAVNGPVTNNFTSSTGGVRAIAGDSTNTYDTSFSPDDNGHDWLVDSTSPGSTGSGFAVDITALGGLTGGRVQIIVNDEGAGVCNLGAIFASAGDLLVSTNGDISSADGPVKAANDIQITTLGAVSLQGAQVSAANNVAITASGITLTDDATGPSIISASNAVSLTSSGDISNTGSTIQAGSVATDGTFSGGDVVLNVADNITNHSTPANLGILFSANGNTTLTAGGDITNDNARILSNKGLTVTAQGDITNEVDHTTGANNGQPSTYSNVGSSFLFFTHTSSGFNIDYGTVAQPDQLADMAAADGPLSISGRNVTNDGGIILADNGPLTITAQQAFSNAAVFAGQASEARNCWIFCHWSTSSDVTPYGGTIQSGADIAIKAGRVASNVGGNVFATGNLAVDAPITYAQGVTGYSSINPDHGFKAFFGSTWVQIIATDVGGGFTADGLLSLTGEGVIDGGSFGGGTGTTAVGGITTVRAPSTTPVLISQHPGLITWWRR
jgi:filamentous hemagglutinin family protein